MAFGCALALAACSDPAEGIDAPPPTPVFPAVDCCPSWIADSLVLYVHEGIDTILANGTYRVDPDSQGVWTAATPSGATRLVLNGPVNTAELSPDRSEIVFGSGGAIYRGDIDDDTVMTASITLLTPRLSSFFPAWSPSGMEVAFDNTNCGSSSLPTECGIFVVSRDGDDERRIVGGRMPDWHPNGRDILYVGAGADLYFVDSVNPASPVLVLALDDEILTPRFSSDGLRIAFTVLGPNGPAVWTVDGNGSNPEVLVQGEWPAWSPGGDMIAFARPFLDRPTDHGTLWAFRLADRAIIRLTKGVGGQ